MDKYSKLDRAKTMGTPGKINAIWWNIKINLHKLVDICGYELPTNLQNFRQKDLTGVKIFQNVIGCYFFETPCRDRRLCLPVRHNNTRWMHISPQDQSCVIGLGIFISVTTWHAQPGTFLVYKHAAGNSHLHVGSGDHKLQRQRTADIKEHCDEHSHDVSAVPVVEQSFIQ